MADDPLAAISELAKKLEGFAENVAKAAAPRIKKALQRSASRGTDPNGEKWRPKKDGSAALVNAPDAIEVTARGPTVRITTKGGYAIQTHIKNKRASIPIEGEPTPAIIVEAIQEAVKDVLKKG